MALGLKEIYFTGGEPFLNRELCDMVEWSLERAAVSILTNATLLRADQLERLGKAASAARYSLEMRVSIDGFTAETNDSIRGAGAFDKAIHGLAQLIQYGFLPIVTATRTWPENEDESQLNGFQHVLRSLGCHRPRIKLLPALHIGAEEQRTHGYSAVDRITKAMFNSFDSGRLLCSRARMVTTDGVHVCPILIDAPDSLLGGDLESSSTDFALSHGACTACYQFGSICANPSSGGVKRMGSPLLSLP